MKQFREDHFYLPNDPGLDVIMVEKRTAKMIFVSTPKGVKWRMKIKVDENGNEYAVDSSVPPHWRCAFTYQALNEG